MLPVTCNANLAMTEITAEGRLLNNKMDSDQKASKALSIYGLSIDERKTSGMGASVSRMLPQAALW